MFILDSSFSLKRAAPGLLGCLSQAQKDQGALSRIKSGLVHGTHMVLSTTLYNYNRHNLKPVLVRAVPLPTIPHIGLQVPWDHCISSKRRARWDCHCSWRGPGSGQSGYKWRTVSCDCTKCSSCLGLLCIDGGGGSNELLPHESSHSRRWTLPFLIKSIRTIFCCLSIQALLLQGALQQKLTEKW